MELVSEAMIFSVKAHDGMIRKKEKTPYILHPMEAAAIVGSITNDPEVIAAAVLHDVVEDAGVTLKELEELFGEKVASLVDSETEDKRKDLPSSATWQIRKEEAIQLLNQTEDMNVKILYLGDKLANMRSLYRDWLKEGNALWECFNEKDPVKQHWYYRSIADATVELSHTPAWQEYDRLIKIIFEQSEDTP